MTPREDVELWPGNLALSLANWAWCPNYSLRKALALAPLRLQRRQLLGYQPVGAKGPAFFRLEFASEAEIRSFFVARLPEDPPMELLP